MINGLQVSYEVLYFHRYSTHSYDSSFVVFMYDEYFVGYLPVETLITSLSHASDGGAFVPQKGVYL